MELNDLCLGRGRFSAGLLNIRLGSVTPTNRYARVDIELKRQAHCQVFPDVLVPPRGGRLLINGADLVGWLHRMQP